jgi:hypothetical protein
MNDENRRFVKGLWDKTPIEPTAEQAAEIFARVEQHKSLVKDWVLAIDEQGRVALIRRQPTSD